MSPPRGHCCRGQPRTSALAQPPGPAAGWDVAAGAWCDPPATLGDICSQDLPGAQHGKEELAESRLRPSKLISCPREGRGMEGEAGGCREHGREVWCSRHAG